jgi:ATP-dependent DNA helicase Rep
VTDFELASGEIDFDQMLSLPVEALRRGHPMRDFLRRAIRYVLVDEAQDVTPVQAELVDHLVGDRGGLTAVGDGDQAI